MSQLSWKIGSAFVLTSWLSVATNAVAQTQLETGIQSINSFSIERQETSIPITKVNQLRDIYSTDWSYEALLSISDRYNCIRGLSDLTYRGNQALSRDEFAVGLNSCLEQIERLSVSSKAIFQEDLVIIKRLIQEFETEIANLRTRTNNLATRTDFLEDKQFSPTTKLAGEVVFGLASVLAGSQNNGEQDIKLIPVFGNSITLELETSFTGEDVLSIELEAVNFPNFSHETGTFQGELSFGGSNDNNLE